MTVKRLLGAILENEKYRTVFQEALHQVCGAPVMNGELSVTVAFPERPPGKMQQMVFKVSGGEMSFKVTVEVKGVEDTGMPDMWEDEGANKLSDPQVSFWKLTVFFGNRCVRCVC